MSEKERLNEVILEEENNGGGTKKVFLIVAIAIIILAVLLMVFWKSTRVAPKETFLQTDSSMQKIGNTKDEKKDDAFESLNLDPSKQESDLDKVADNVKKQESDAFKMPTDQTQTEMKTTEETQEAKKELKAVENTGAQKESQAVAKKETPYKEPKAKKEAHKDKAKHAAKEPKAKKEAHKEVSKKANSKTNLRHYLQVGVFAHTPNKAFLQAFNQFPHKIEDRGATKRYLIGPYKSKQEALMHADEVSKKMTKPVVIEAR